MTKAQSRALRNIKGHCKYSSCGYYTEMDKRRWKAIFNLLSDGKLKIVSYTDKSVSVKPV
jgi:hypothetical protein